MIRKTCDFLFNHRMRFPWIFVRVGSLKGKGRAAKKKDYLGVSKNNGTPKSSILIGFSIINHPFWGTPIFGNIHLNLK